MSSTLPISTESTGNFVLNSPPEDSRERKKWIQNELQRMKKTQGAKDFSSVFGQWPGQETDEEIESFLKELS